MARRACTTSTTTVKFVGYTSPARTYSWYALLVAAFTVVLGLVLAAVPAPAVTLPATETRFGASGSATAVVVGVHECIAAGQRPTRGPSQPQVALGNCVAAEALLAG
jgi:hypothetical protein